jgi:hypothetical protein
MSADPELLQALLQEIAAYARHISDPQARSICDALQSAVQTGELDEEMLRALGHVLSVSLESGRLRKLYGPHVEMQAERLFQLTPQGQQLQSALTQANQALATLAGQTIQEIRVTPKGPGAFYLLIRTDQYRWRFLVDRSGLHPVELETGT